MSNTKKEIGAILRTARKKRGLTQIELANQINTNQVTIRTIERGMANPTLEKLLAISKKLNVQIFNLNGK